MKVHLGGDGGEVGESEHEDAPHADDDAGEGVLADEVEAGEDECEQEADGGHEAVEGEPVEEDAEHHAGEEAEHAAQPPGDGDQLGSGVC